MKANELINHIIKSTGNEPYHAFIGKHSINLRLYQKGALPSETHSEIDCDGGDYLSATLLYPHNNTSIKRMFRLSERAVT